MTIARFRMFIISQMFWMNSTKHMKIKQSKILRVFSIHIRVEERLIWKTLTIQM